MPLSVGQPLGAGRAGAAHRPHGEDSTHGTAGGRQRYLGSLIARPSYNPGMRKGLGRDIHINRKEPDFYMAPSTQHLMPGT